MRLDENKELFSQAIRATSDYLNIQAQYIEKDYWICRVLKQLSQCEYADMAVFKGGTSLSKGYGVISRFSEDVDVAILTGEQNGNQVKTAIRKIVTRMTDGLPEVEIEGVTSKGSRYRKSLHEYPAMADTNYQEVSNRIVVEVNSFANPYPYERKMIRSFITQYMESAGLVEYIRKFGMESFELNVLDKRRTLCEKTVSLLRFSFSENPAEGIAGKIRHFYDLYFLLADMECADYVRSHLTTDLRELAEHDKMVFTQPMGWQEHSLHEAPLLSDFGAIWGKISPVYERELSLLAYSPIPTRNEIEGRIADFIGFLHRKLNEI